MPKQAAALRRCGSCERWSGERSVADVPGFVRVTSETADGLCIGGPWDGEARKARSACGRWSCWPEVAHGVMDSM